MDGVEAFLAVARQRSFRKAAAELGVSPSAASQAVRALESRLGTALFARTTRSVGLTEAGERFLSRVGPAYEELAAAGEEARSLGRRPAGLLRLTVPPAVVPILLEPLLASFGQAYPDVEVEIAASPELRDIASEGFDAGIRFGQFIAADMVAVRLTPSFPLTVVGSPGYLCRKGRPGRIGDLRRHACIRMRRSDGAVAPWSFVEDGKPVEAVVSGSLIVRDFSAMLGAAIEGAGLAQVPGPIAAGPMEDGRLVSVLGPFAPMMPGMFLYYPGRHQMTPKLRAFIDHLKSYPGADATV
ncbi:MAG: LysR family transcriptional regulator [Rhodanobacter sp.]